MREVPKVCEHAGSSTRWKQLTGLREVLEPLAEVTHGPLSENRIVAKDNEAIEQLPDLLCRNEYGRAPQTLQSLTLKFPIGAVCELKEAVDVGLFLFRNPHV
jgi:hypothetical protein